ncbi:hypothetical protein FRB98_000419 [Tulasnella sp. 332]|nr:hypothetical protein FRB98_000419 [Tulasnella sp. 332]
MKRLRSHTSESRETVDVQRRLQREARIWSSLAHPNTLPFLGLEEISNETYLVSPWMENGDLSKFCVERLRYLALTTHDQSLIPTAQVKAFGRFDEFDIVSASAAVEIGVVVLWLKNYFTQTRGIARGLAYLHDRGVIHGDLKAANVLLDDSVNPMLSDFGMSKVMEGTYGRTSPALKGMGSTRWKSPELMDDCPKTMKSDVYALGMTIVEVLTGRMPFHKISSQEKVMLEVTNGSRPPFEPLSRGNRSFAALWSLASSCWVADPDKRPSANEIAAGFATAVTSSDPTDGPTDIAASIISVPNNVAFPLTSNLNSPRDPRWPMKPSPGMADPVRLPSTTNRDQNQPIRVTAPPQNNNGQTFNKVNDDRQRHDAQRRPQSNQSPSDALWKAGDDHRKAGRYDDACAELDAACRAYHREGNWLGAAKCLWSLGRVYRKRGQHKEAYSMLQKACRVYEDFGDLSGMAACLRSLGDVLRGQGLYEKACSTLMEAWRVYQQLGDGLGMADSLKSIAHVHRQQGNYHGAEKVLKVACQAYRKEQDNFAVADCLKDLGDVYRKQRKYEDAQFALQEAFEIQTQLGNARSMEDYPRGTSDAYRVQGPLASRPELPQTQTERRTPGADVLVAGSVDITPDRHSPLDMSQTAEAEAFLKRLSRLPEDSGAPLTSAITPSLEDESILRRLFATNRDHKRLQNPYVGLVDAFGASTDCIRNIRARQIKDGADLTDKYVMAFDETTRRNDGELAMAPTFEDFKTRWAIFSEGSLSQLIDWTRVVAVGGSVLACLAPLSNRVATQGPKRAIRKYYHSEAYPASDIDLFLYGMTPEQAEEKCKAIFSAVRDSVPWEVTTVMTKNALSIHSQYPYRSIQIVLRLYQSPAEILAGFDVDSACVAFDGQRILAAPRAVMSLIMQSNQVAMDRRSPSYEVRLTKYAQRGFEIHIPELRRRDIFKRALSRVPGLARLLVLEKLSSQEARGEFLSARHIMRGRPADSSGRFHRRDWRLKGDLKTQNQLGGLQMNDYDVAFHIPYGPGIDARKIEKMVYQTDLGMNRWYLQSKEQRAYLAPHPAFFGTMEDAMEDCYQNSKLDFCFLSFMQEDPGRQSMTGSFRPIDEGEWSDQAYIKPVTRLFMSIASHDRAAAADFVKKNADSIRWRDHVGRTALQFAIQCSARDICKDLIQAGAWMTARLVDGRTSLHIACQMGDMEDVVAMMLAKSDLTKKVVEERANTASGGKDSDSDVEMKDGQEKMNHGKDFLQDPSEDDWTDQDEHEEDNEDYSKAKTEVQPATEPVLIEDDVFEESNEADVLDINAADWDQSVTPLGAPLTKDENVAGQIAAHLVVAGGATSAAADEETISVFHRLTVAALLRVDPTAKTAARFLKPSWSDAVSPMTTASAGGFRAMVAVLIAYAGSPVFIDQETFDRSVAAIPNPPYGLKQDNSYAKGVLQPLEAALCNYNDLYRLAITLEPDSARTFVPKAVYCHQEYDDRRRSLLDLLRGYVTDLETSIAKTTLKTVLAESVPKDEIAQELNNGPYYGSILNLSQMEISTKTGWEAEAIRLEKQFVENQKRSTGDYDVLVAQRQA